MRARRLTLSVLLLALAACDDDAEKVDPAEKGRFIQAHIAAACAVKRETDLTRAGAVVQEAVKAHGFDAQSYAAASARFAALPDVKSATEAALALCTPTEPAAAAAPAAADVQPAPEAAKKKRKGARRKAGSAKAEAEPADDESAGGSEKKSTIGKAAGEVGHAGKRVGKAVGGAAKEVGRSVRDLFK